MESSKETRSLGQTLASSKAKGPAKASLSHKDSEFRIRKTSERQRRAHNKQVKAAISSVYSAAPTATRGNQGSRGGKLPELHGRQGGAMRVGKDGRISAAHDRILAGNGSSASQNPLGASFGRGQAPQLQQKVAPVRHRSLANNAPKRKEFADPRYSGDHYGGARLGAGLGADSHPLNSQKLAADRIIGSISKQSLASASLGQPNRGQPGTQPGKPVMLQHLPNA